VWETIAIEGQGATMSVRHLRGDGRRWALLLHDAGADRRSLRHLVTAFTDGTDLLVPDLRGHGASTLRPGAPATLEGILGDLEALIGTVGIGHLEVLGQGLGARVAQELAHRRPDIVESLVLIGGRDQHRAPGPAERLSGGLGRALARSVPWAWSARARAQAATAVPAVRDELSSGLLSAGRDVVLDLERSAAQGRHPVGRYRMPVLLIRGEHEDPSRVGTVHGCIAARSRRGHAVAIPGAGALCHLEQPDQTNAAIRAFRDL
jgi:pimeloyl-ACP methyl ester carboxylesterase